MALTENYRPEDVTVLIVDDEPDNADLLARALRGYRLLVAKRGDEALTMLAENRVDIIVTDQRMPGVSGSTVLERARRVNPLARRMIVSAFADVPGLLEAINRGEAERYILKPLDPDTVRREVDALAAAYVRAEAERAEVAHLEQQLSRLRRGMRRAVADRRGRSRLRIEVARAQRYSRPLALLVISGGQDLAVRIAPRVREVDVIAQIGDDLVIAMPETTREGAELVRQRFQALFPDVSFRVAAFPEAAGELDPVFRDLL